MSSPHLVIVPHTHWDREWYRTHEAFRVRLVSLVDLVLDILEQDPSFRHFTLDGQTIVLDDYLAVRPGARPRIEKLVAEGRLVVGPWHVLPDEWLVSGEALIRNLRFGLERAGAVGGAMRVGYVPDQFGHVGQLPQIFSRFGFSGAALWRGVGADVTQSGFWWEAPDGTRLFTLYLATGYGNAASLPVDPESLSKRLERAKRDLSPFVRGSTFCLMNGSDHLPPQPGLPAAIGEAVLRLAEPVTWEIGTLPLALDRVRAEQAAAAPVHRGELRSGLRAPLLPGCASSRLAQKQREFENDYRLTRVVEPLAAWAGRLGTTVDRELLDFTWSVALENHPHDSICGCSVDDVHAQMETRFDRVADLARAQLDRVVRTLAAWIEPPRAGAGAGDAFGVWNPTSGGTVRVEADLELDLPGLDPARTRSGQRIAAHVRGSGGRRIAADVCVRTPGLVWRTPFPLALARHLLPDLPRELMGYHANAVSWARDDRSLRVEVVVGSEPRGDFDLSRVKRELGAVLGDPALQDLAIEARLPATLGVAFTDALPGHGIRSYRIAGGRSRNDGAVSSGRVGSGAFVQNETWRIEAAADGAVTLRHLPSGTQVLDAVRVVSEGDRGDTYNFDPVPGGPKVERARSVRVRLETPATLAVSLRLRVPRSLSDDRTKRSPKEVDLPVTLRLRLHPGVDRVDVIAQGENGAQDHRLRIHLRAPFSARRFEVESAFETAERPIAPAADGFGSDQPAEFPVGAVPQRSFATIADGTRALTVAARGSSEVEAVPEADGSTSLAVTLLRATGHLSLGDLLLRPGPAGPLFPTPGAQAQGPFHAALSFRLHGDGDADRVAQAHGFAYPPAAFATGFVAAAAGIADGDRLVEIDDPAIVVSAIEPGPCGALRVRLYEATGRPRRLRGRIPGASAIRALDLTGRPDADLSLVVMGDRFEADLRGAQIVDLEACFDAPAGERSA